jgi:DNA-binding transcriptional regulator YhcF (GntR family)
MIYGLGSRARPVYENLRRRIIDGTLSPGTRLPSHAELAGQYGVAPMTIRSVIATLEVEGLLSRQRGRGTFVRAVSASTVLVIDADAETRNHLLNQLQFAGCRTLEAHSAEEAISVLEQDASVRLVLCRVHLPVRETGLRCIRAIRVRWPDLPLCALTDDADDLALLHGRPECPVMTLARPVRAHHLAEVLRFALGSNVVPAMDRRRTSEDRR